MMPADFRDLTDEHLRPVLDLQLTGLGCHAAAPQLFATTPAECQRVRELIRAADMDLVQFAISYGECLFDPEAAVRDRLVELIGKGIEVGRALDAHFVLIRPGSLNPDGPYSPAPENHQPQARDRLVDTLRRASDIAAAAGASIVIETHALTVMGSPETNRDILAAVGSDRLTVVMDYVNHFQSMHQAFNSTDRLNHIFDVMGPISGVGHCKDLVVDSGLVLHLNEAMPGEGQLDLVTALRRWHESYPDGYMLLEHLPAERYPQASINVHRIIADAGIPVH